MDTQDDKFYKEPTRKEWAGFWTLVLVQAQNAFNEKAVQFLLIPLGVCTLGAAGSTLEYLLGAIFVLPYILFSPLVGWLADCFCKTRIIQVMSILQVFVMGCMLYCFYRHNLAGAIAWFAVFATQATILSPAKKGIVKDLLGSRYIGYGSGIMEMSMVFVLLAAQIGVFFLFSNLLTMQQDGDTPQALQALYDLIAPPPGAGEEATQGWNAVKLPTWVFLGLACVVSAAAFLLPRYHSKQTRKFSWSLFYEHFIQVKYLLRNRLLTLAEGGISFFWCLAGSLFLIIIQIAKDLQVQDPSIDFSLQCGILMAWLTGGVVTGGVTASILCKGKNELGLIPVASIGITICTLMLSIFDANTLPSNIMLALTGAFGAAYLVPLNAYLQDNCDPDNRGNIIAAGNLIDNLMGLLAVGLIWTLHSLGGSSRVLFYATFLMSSIVMLLTLRLIPQEGIRMLGIWILKLFYKPRVINPERIPERGGALIIANHATYADALYLTMISPRPIRFVVSEEFAGHRLLSWLLEIFNSLTISTKNPREALHNAVQSIEAGALICIFPEGQLTRSGCLVPIRRSLELMARRLNAPIIPIYMDGLWGSIFSFSRGRFFTKLPRRLPYPFTAAIGEWVEPEDFSSRVIFRRLRSLSATCLEGEEWGTPDMLVAALDKLGKKKFLHWKGESLTATQIAQALRSREVSPYIPEPAHTWLTMLLSLTADERFENLWANVSQIRRVNALKEGNHHLLTTIGLNEPHEAVLAILWPIVTHTPVHLIGTPDEQIDPSISQIVGSAHMRRILLTAIPPRQVPFFDCSNGPDISTPNTRWRPCLTTASGTVIAMSMRQSVFKMRDGTIQLGFRPRTRGLLLPGFSVTAQGDESSGTAAFIISGPAFKSGSYTLPSKMYIDESGFLAELS